MCCIYITTNSLLGFSNFWTLVSLMGLAIFGICDFKLDLYELSLLDMKSIDTDKDKIQQ